MRLLLWLFALIVGGSGIATGPVGVASECPCCGPLEGRTRLSTCLAAAGEASCCAPAEAGAVCTCSLASGTGEDPDRVPAVLPVPVLALVPDSCPLPVPGPLSAAGRATPSAQTPRPRGPEDGEPGAPRAPPAA